MTSKGMDKETCTKQNCLHQAYVQCTIAETLIVKKNNSMTLCFGSITKERKKGREGEGEEEGEKERERREETETLPFGDRLDNMVESLVQFEWLSLCT